MKEDKKKLEVMKDEETQTELNMIYSEALPAELNQYVLEKMTNDPIIKAHVSGLISALKVENVAVNLNISSLVSIKQG